MENEYRLDHNIDKLTGNLHYLGFSNVDKQMNFVANPVDLCLIDSKSSSKVPGFGAICLSYLTEDRLYFQTGKWLELERNENDGNTFVFQDTAVLVEKRFITESNKLYINIKIHNKLKRTLEIDELSISVPVNNNFTEMRYEQEYLYNYKVHEHIYPGGSSGYQLIQRLSGESPFVYVIPGEKTYFEYSAHFPETISYSRKGVVNHSWPGSSMIFLRSKGYLERNKFKKIMGEGSSTSCKIGPGSEVSYSIEIGLVNSIEEFKDVLIKKGKIHITAIPGMVLPIDNIAHLFVGSESDIFLDKDEGFQIKELSKGNAGFNVKLLFCKTGEHFINIRNKSNQFARLVFYITPPVKELLEKRVRFILENQVFNDEQHKLNGAILPYSVKPFVGNGDIKYGEGIFVKEDSLWGNGSYEGGITEAMFVAHKNVLVPDEWQISKLETYIKKYVRRYLQNVETNEVIWWCGAFSTQRAFDYMHLANLYYSMHLISDRYNLTKEFTALDYLMFSYETLMKMFEKSRALDMVVGLMGGQNIFHILESMQKNDIMVLQYYELLMKVHAHRRNLFTDNLPYGSECAYDNTGYECVMSYSDYYKDDAWIGKLKDIILAARSTQPVWWWYASDIRWWDAENDFSECCLHYTSPLNSSALLMALLGNKTDTSIDMLSNIYGGILGVLSKIHSDGSGSMSYCWEQESVNYGFHPFSGDIGLGLYGSLLCIGSFAYYSMKYGLIGCLCGVVEDDKSKMITVLPKDGIGKRFMWSIETEHLKKNESEVFRGKVELSSGIIKEIKINPEEKKIVLEIINEFHDEKQTEVLIQYPADYSTVLTVNGKLEKYCKTQKDSVKINYLLRGKEQSTEICLKTCKRNF